MQENLVEILMQFGTVAALVIFGFVLFALLGSGTSLGRAMLPRSVLETAARLLPRGQIKDATSTGIGEFQLRVAGNAKLQTVHVHPFPDMTIAWTFDSATASPQSGTFAFTGLRHNLMSGSKVNPKKFEARIRETLTEVLADKQFFPGAPSTADISVNVFGAIENEVAVRDLGVALGRQDDREWTSAFATALSHSNGEEVSTVARGSLMLDVVETKSSQVLWHALAVASFVVEESDAQNYLRTQAAIKEMLRRFPPHRV